MYLIKIVFDYVPITWKNYLNISTNLNNLYYVCIMYVHVYRFVQYTCDTSTLYLNNNYCIKEKCLISWLLYQHFYYYLKYLTTFNVTYNVLLEGQHLC